MKRRPRRKAGADRDEEDNASSCSTPTKDKENLSPSTKGRQSVDVYQQQFLALLANFDQNGNNFSCSLLLSVFVGKQHSFLIIIQ